MSTPIEELDIWGEPYSCPHLYWSRSLAKQHGISINGLIRTKNETGERLYFAHEGMCWRRIETLPEDVVELWPVTNERLDG